MPELPEVENVVRLLDSSSYSLRGRRIVKVALFWQALLISGRPDLLEGKIFVSFRRYGKYIILGTGDNGVGHVELFLVIHLRMTGNLFLEKTLQAPGVHTRLIISLDDGGSLRFDDSRKFGKMWITDDVNSIICGLGPDALTVAFSDFEKRIALYNRQIKPLLLDQSFIAGIGNIYADEILFCSGIHPRSLTGTFCIETVRRLHRSIISVLAEAVDKKGANINDTFKEGGFIVNVYGREGKPCRKCGLEIVKIRVAQRGTHLCSNCQSFKDFNLK